MTDVRATRFVLRPAALTEPSSPVYRGVARAAGVCRDRAKVNITQDGRIDTGRMRNSIDYEIKVTPTQIVAMVGTRLFYARYQHDGTANNGNGYIVPRRAKMLRFKPKGGGAFVYAARVRGVRGTKFLERAKDSLTDRDFEP